MMPILRAMTVCLMLAAAGQPWEFMGGVGYLRFVYVEPARMKDTKLISQIVGEMFTKFGKEKPMEIDFFDDRAAIPRTIPFSPEQRRHERAKFNFNPRNDLQRFVWLELVPDPNDPTRIRLKETEEKLP